MPQFSCHCPTKCPQLPQWRSDPSDAGEYTRDIISPPRVLPIALHTVFDTDVPSGNSSNYLLIKDAIFLSPH